MAMTVPGAISVARSARPGQRVTPSPVRFLEAWQSPTLVLEPPPLPAHRRRPSPRRVDGPELRLRRVDATATVFAGAAQQARMLSSGDITSPDLLELYFERIGRLDGLLNAYRVVRWDRARA